MNKAAREAAQAMVTNLLKDGAGGWRQGGWARRIARTETSEASTAITRVRSKSAGLLWYVRCTSDDSRVCDSKNTGGAAGEYFIKCRLKSDIEQL